MKFEYVADSRIGDHICYISDLASTAAPYPSWGISKSLELSIFQEIFRTVSANSRRLRGLKAQMYELMTEPGRQERNYSRDLRGAVSRQVLAWRDVSVRYKQTVIGVAWALVRPFLTMVVFTVIFGKIARLPSEGTAPYALIVFRHSAWTFLLGPDGGGGRPGQQCRTDRQGLFPAE